MAVYLQMSTIVHCCVMLVTMVLCEARSVKHQKYGESNSTCLYNNQAYRAGTRFQPDKCTLCHCPRNGGRPNCAIEDCKYEPNCVKYVKTSQSQCCDICVERGCQDANGTVYKPGEVVSITSCTWCRCPKSGGRIECSHMKCPGVECVDPVLQPGDCCLTCPNGPNCWLGSQILPVGKVIRGSRCKTCRCPDNDTIPSWLQHKGTRATCTIDLENC